MIIVDVFPYDTFCLLRAYYSGPSIPRRFKMSLFIGNSIWHKLSN